MTYADIRWAWNGPINTKRWVFDMFSSTAPALASSHLLLPPRTCHQPHPPVSGEGHPRGQLLQQQAAAQGRTGLQPSRCLLRIAQPPVVLPALHLPLMEVVDINFNQFKLAACNSMTTNTSDLIFFLSLFVLYPEFLLLRSQCAYHLHSPCYVWQFGAHLQFAMPFDGTSDLHVKIRFGVRALLICDTHCLVSWGTSYVTSSFIISYQWSITQDHSEYVTESVVFNCNCYACKPVLSDLHCVWCRFLCLMESTGVVRDMLFSSCHHDSTKILWTMSELNICWLQEILCLL
jgi:hypothetical protein